MQTGSMILDFLDFHSHGFIQTGSERPESVEAHCDRQAAVHLTKRRKQLHSTVSIFRFYDSDFTVQIIRIHSFEDSRKNDIHVVAFSTTLGQSFFQWHLEPHLKHLPFGCSIWVLNTYRDVGQVVKEGKKEKNIIRVRVYPYPTLDLGGLGLGPKFYTLEGIGPVLGPSLTIRTTPNMEEVTGYPNDETLKVLAIP
ncbi:hypothetical protein M9H77_23770 [Catharanthus roseus]|uniref:Uncharacterized protein n=1 Tax=Catharanthus roseus TaxID=4058 RepID=A0ACC0AVI0_CATRO|nr:hypothetical protein M9H77_23770 [Catharanthus roseus]